MNSRTHADESSRHPQREGRLLASVLYVAIISLFFCSWLHIEPLTNLLQAVR